MCLAHSEVELWFSLGHMTLHYRWPIDFDVKWRNGGKIHALNKRPHHEHHYGYNSEVSYDADS